MPAWVQIHARYLSWRAAVQPRQSYTRDLRSGVESMIQRHIALLPVQSSEA